MESFKRDKFTEYWTVRVRDFPANKRREIERLAESQRQSIGSYVGNLLDEQIRKAREAEARL